MDCMIYIILTDEHAGLNEALATTKYMQASHGVALLTYDLSHYSRYPLTKKKADNIKDLIEPMSNYYDNTKSYIVADESQVESVKKFFSNTTYDITAYVMRDKINLNN